VTPKDATRCWKFDAAVDEDSLVLCSECQEASPLREWKEDTVYCEDCGDHLAMGCPRCDYLFDHVFASMFHVIPVKAQAP